MRDLLGVDQGGELAFTYQGDALKKRVEPLAASLGADGALAVARPGGVGALALPGQLEEQAPAFAVAPVEPRLRFAGGALEILEPGQDGTRLDVLHWENLVAILPTFGAG